MIVKVWSRLLCSCGHVSVSPVGRLAVSVRAGRLVIVWRCDECPIGLRTVEACCAGRVAGGLATLGAAVSPETLAAAVRLSRPCAGHGPNML